MNSFKARGVRAKHFRQNVFSKKQINGVKTRHLKTNKLDRFLEKSQKWASEIAQ